MVSLKKFQRKYSRKAGLPPGTLMYTGVKKEEAVKIHVINYDENSFDEHETLNIEEALKRVNKTNMTWIKISGVHDIKIVEKIGGFFNLHPLLLEDIMDIQQRPKCEEFGEYILIVAKRLYFEENENSLKDFQISFIIGDMFTISFQEQLDNIFDNILERITKAKGRVRQLGSDYLAYRLLDAIVDSYFIVLDNFTNRIETVEDLLVENPSHEITYDIHHIKRDVLFLHKSIWPLRDIINGLARAESPNIKQTTSIYFRDIQNHIIQIIDTIDTFREMLNGMFEIYLTSVSNKLNEIMKILTIISTIFIPLSFIASLYGMNFKYMPELYLPSGYYIILFVMMIIGFTMLLLFWRKRWL
jgi:magnesium transporter